MTETVPGLFQEAQECAVVLCGVSEAEHLLALLVPQNLLATVDKLKEHYRRHPVDLLTGNVALTVLQRYVGELRNIMSECLLESGNQSLGALAGMYLAWRLPSDGGHVVN